MKITLVRKGIFGKKYLRLPEGFLKNHERKSGKATPIHGRCNDDFIIVSTSEKALNDKEVVIEEVLNKYSEKVDYLVKFTEDANEVPYRDVTGFFSFRGVVYCKMKGAGGKAISDCETNFSNSIKERFPEEFENVTLQTIGSVLVKPLQIQ